MSLTVESFHETFDLLNSKTFELEKIIVTAGKNSPKLTIPEIIPIYYRVMETNSLIKVLRQNLEIFRENKVLIDPSLIIKINEIEKKIPEIFDNQLHPTIMSQLTTEIETLMNTLNSEKKIPYDTKPNNVIQKEAKQYDRLRELLSTKEFTIQYDKGLKE